MPFLDTARKFEFVGGETSLDYCNTVGGKRGFITREYLGTYLDFLAWCHQSGLLDRSQAEACAEQAALAPASAVATLERAVKLREAIFGLLTASTGGNVVCPSDLATLNSELAQALSRLHLTAPKEGEGFAWRWEMQPGGLDQPLGQIAHAAASLLANLDRLKRVHMCNGQNCGWLFLDSSKNHSRRWCDMGDCGNRAKVRRHRARQRRAKSSN